MMKRFLVIVLVLVFAVDVSAQGRRSRRGGGEGLIGGQEITTAAKPYTGKDKEAKDALAEVNAARAARGLKPYLNDPLLNQAAYAAASYRAAHLINGHVPGGRGDFQFLPAGADSHVAGCGGLDPSWGWGACGTYGNYTYCGAAWVMGKDGKRYMHAFYR